ncbi:AI-2E family transporter [uncultured Jannaschia sp.]|uniref:AI-2E family transporter n=1 Tax=uncultured Jannaschia sp. TaxID=293347 RepID=UPI002610A1E1|nr:AI-2E family transporter [uncultured Jannaschia sp.]
MDDRHPRDAQTRERSVLLGCVVAIALILIVWALRATGAVVVPVVFSVFLALLVVPVDRKVSERAPRGFHWLGHVAAMGTILLALLVFFGSIWLAAEQVVDRFPLGTGETGLLPAFGSDASETAAGGPSPGAAPSPTSAPAEDATRTDVGGLRDHLGTLFGTASGSLTGRLAELASDNAAAILGAAEATLGSLVLIFFLTLLMLVEAPHWRKKVASLAGGSRQDAMDSVGIVADRLRRYLLARTILGLLTGMLYVAWLWIFGLDLLIVWALLAFFLNFVPTFGSLIAGALPVLYAFLQKDPGTAALIGGGLLVIEQIMGNYIDPRVQGKQVSLSPLVVLVVLLFWGWVWGLVGTILAVPVTIAITVIAAHVRPLRPVALLLSDKTDPDDLDELKGDRSH